LLPLLKAEIDCAIQDTFLVGGYLFVHIHIVNLVNSPVSVRSLSLTNQATGRIFKARPFTKAALVRRGKIKVELQASLDHFSKKESRILDSFDDLLESLHANPLVKGVGRAGWILFCGHGCDVPSISTLPLSVCIEDAFGGAHNSAIKDISVDYGMVTV
jgi:hypothetical protein